MKRVVAYFVTVAAVCGLVIPAWAAFDQNGNAQRVSVYGKSTNAGDTAFKLASDGALAVDIESTTGNVTVVGPAADGAAVSGNPVRVGGKDGSGNTQDILTDTGGAVQVDVESGTVTANAGTGTFTTGGAAADGAAVSGNPTRIALKDGSGNTQDLIGDTTGRLVAGGLQLTIPTSMSRLALNNGSATQGSSIAARNVTVCSDDGGATNGNTAVVWMAGSDVAANVGIPLRPGQCANDIEITNLNQLYFFVGAASHYITFFLGS